MDHVDRHLRAERGGMHTARIARPRRKANLEKPTTGLPVLGNISGGDGRGRSARSGPYPSRGIKAAHIARPQDGGGGTASACAGSQLSTHSIPAVSRIRLSVLLVSSAPA